MFLRHIRKSKNHSDNETIAAIDIGNSKVCCSIAKIQETEGYKVIGFGYQNSNGLKNGHIIDMQEAELSILNAVHLAEQMAQESIKKVYVNLPLCSSKNLGLEIPVTGHAVDSNDVKRLLQLTQQFENNKSLELVHTIPTGYDIDGREGIKDPSGMFGDKLGVNVHKIYTNKSHLRNLTTCIKKCHLEPVSFVASPLSSGLSSLVDDEMELGSAIIDMGAGLTTIGVFCDNSIIFTSTINVGGEQVTKDIARTLSTPLAQAERLKTLHGSALLTAMDEREMVRIPQIAEFGEESKNVISKAELIRVIQPRIEETFEHIKAKLSSKSIAKNHFNRIVLTGGASQLPGVSEIANKILGKQIRLSRPISSKTMHNSMNSPSFSACAGLLTFAYAQYNEKIINHNVNFSNNKIYSKVSRWIKENI